jgi:hypothetical protein
MMMMIMMIIIMMIMMMIMMIMMMMMKMMTLFLAELRTDLSLCDDVDDVYIYQGKLM